MDRTILGSITAQEEETPINDGIDTNEKADVASLIDKARSIAITLSPLADIMSLVVHA